MGEKQDKEVISGLLRLYARGGKGCVEVKETIRSRETSRHNNNRRNTLGMQSSKESMRKVVFSTIIEINESRSGSILVCLCGEDSVGLVNESELRSRTPGFRSFHDDAFDEKRRKLSPSAGQVHNTAAALMREQKPCDFEVKSCSVIGQTSKRSC